MKKKFFVFLMAIFCFIMTGCNKYDKDDIAKNLKKMLEKNKGYSINGELEIFNNEDSYIYDVNVYYSKDDNYKVSLKNKINNHEQIILRNNDGVYVLTPSLNKSFKFQSEWPYNNSQSYLIQILLKDMENDEEMKSEKNDNGYIVTTKVNYSNNKDLVKQNIYFDNNLNITDVHVLDNNDNVKMKMHFNKIDFNNGYEDSVFELDDNMASATYEREETVSKIEDIIYPMYLPTGTHLVSQDIVATNEGERLILTFDGDKSFMFVQETATVPNNLITIPVDGEPEIIADTVAALSDSSISWSNNGIEYYVVSDNLDKNELLNVAKSVSVMPIAK